MKPLSGIVAVTASLLPVSTLADSPQQSPTFETLSANMALTIPTAGQPRPLVLYSWTTPEQAKAIRKGGPVLTRSKSPTKGYATFDQWLSLRAAVALPNGLEKILFAQGFARKRFAWPNALGAIRGLGDGSYGNVLLRIELRPESTFITAANDVGFSASTAAGAELKGALESSTIAAVQYVSATYREYIVLNESMIASVSIATPEIAQQLELEAALLTTIDVTNSAHRELLSALSLQRAVAPTKASIDELKLAVKRAIAELGTKPYRRDVTAPFVLGAQRAAIPNQCAWSGPSGDVSYTPPRVGQTCSVTCAPTRPPTAGVCVPNPPPGN
jgi:hypothetical protein